MSSRTTDMIAAVLIVIFGIVVWVYAGAFPSLGNRQPGPALFPRLVAMLFVLSGATLLFQSLRGRSRTADEAEGEAGSGLQFDLGGVLRAGTIIGLTAFYPLLQDRLGFVPTVSALSFMVALLLRARPWVAALTAIGGTLIINLIFTRLLGVPL